MTIITGRGISPPSMCTHCGTHCHQVLCLRFRGGASTSFGLGAQEEGDDYEEDNDEGDEEDEEGDESDD